MQGRINAKFASVCLALASCAGVPDLPNPAPSEWLIIDNFEHPDALDAWTIFDAQNDTDPYVPNAQITEIRIETGADAGTGVGIGPAGNHYLIRKPAADGIVGNRKALSWRALPQTLESGAIATFYTRVNVEKFPNNHSFGLSNVSPQQMAALAYDAFEPMLRITDKSESDGTQNDGTLMVMVADKAYSNITNPATGQAAQPMVPGAWYELWYVVDNRARAAGGQTYTLYLRGGEFAQQTLVFEGAQFRIAREAPLTHFIAITNTGPARDPYGNGGVLYDDLYMASGTVLSTPQAR